MQLVILQDIDPGTIIGAIFIGLALIIASGVFFYFKNMIVVPFNEIHVISSGTKTKTFDGKGRYCFIKFLMSKTIIPKHVLDIEPGLLDLLDCDNLPFGVEISVKVQVTDPQKAAATLTRIDHSTVAKVVEDTVMSAARSIAMERTILDIMKKREEVEQRVYSMVADALGKLGLSAIIFDIKNIRDTEGNDVITSLERVKIAELRKNAQVAEAIHNKESFVKSEQMKQEQETARLIKEQDIIAKQVLVDQERLILDKQQSTKKAEIEKERLKIMAEAEKEKNMIDAEAEAEVIRVKAEAEAEAIKLKAIANAEAILKKGIAEAEVLKKKNAAMGGNYAAQIELSKILSKAQIDSAGKIAEALGKNNKIMYLPVDGDNGLLSNFLPKIDAFFQSGIPTDIMGQLSGKKNIKKLASK
ncbi:SPFH domain-containing protein [Promethearchaeum syntrophicum]|uniref:SPFH domain-containing protein n=1 Tax=Promethearchaeum syntrophicum TaxID=2594042 RepID=A0A5B9DC01_9ARCH|nr:SPFH domain-containing protein [Candidatus Prometheoarchaeum syntrophicum]QEE16387.1 SPFH domain / Band 7 family protein [Candidatus Prometheoarchaeum syntrophicum]